MVKVKSQWNEKEFCVSHADLAAAQKSRTQDTIQPCSMRMSGSDLIITHYFGAAWQVPWGCLAVIVVVVLAAVVLAVYNPVRRILMQPITATISEL